MEYLGLALLALSVLAVPGLPLMLKVTDVVMSRIESGRSE